MYNTSRHDHFLWLKPLKMAPYFLKPIDLPSKSVCICPEITCSLIPRPLQPSSQTLLKISVFSHWHESLQCFTTHIWLADNKYMVVRLLGSTGSSLDNVTVFIPCWIYGPGRDTDGQKPTAARKPVNPTWYIMQRQKKRENHHSFIPPQRNLMQKAQFLTFLGRK